MAKKPNVSNKPSMSKRESAHPSNNLTPPRRRATHPQMFGVPTSTVLKTVQLLEREGVLDEFVLRSKGMSIDSEPFDEVS